MQNKCVQLDFLLSNEAAYKNWEVQQYKQKTFKSIRGLYARHKDMKTEIADLKKMITEMFHTEMETSSKRVVFESDVEKIVEDVIDSEKSFLNFELLEYKSITDKSLRSLAYKYNEMEATLLDFQKFMDKVVFKEMEHRAQA